MAARVGGLEPFLTSLRSYLTRFEEYDKNEMARDAGEAKGDSGKVIWSDTVYITDSSSTDEQTDFVLYVILLRKWHFQKYQYINPISFWVPST